MSPHERITRYVMGELNEAEQFRVEEQYFAEAEFLREVQAVCSELIDDYLTGAMSAPDRERFEKRLHVLPFLREQVETSRALLEYAKTAAAARTEPVRKQRGAFAGWWTPRRNFWPRLAWAGVLGGLLIIGIWYWRQTRLPRPTEAMPVSVAQASATPAATLPPSVPAAPTPTVAASSPKSAPKTQISPVVASLLLSANITRSDAQPARLSLPTSNGQVLLQLELPSAQPQSYQATLQTAQGQTIRTWRKVTAIRYQTVFVAELKVPAALLPRGAYWVTLTSPPAISYRFPFLVEAP